MSRFVSRTLATMGMRYLTPCKKQVLQSTRLYSSLTPVKVSPTLSSTLMKSHNVHSKSCGCCGYHTQGDKQMVEFLTEEITMEKQAVKTSSLPSVPGFEVSRNDAEVVLTKKRDGETLTVRFNINHTIQTEEPVKTSQEEETQMISKPPFSVEIAKDNTTLAIQCSFPPPEDLDDPTVQDGDIVDEFDIEEIALHGAEWEDSTYVVSAATMDGNLYDLLMTMLEDRGIDNTFAHDLINYSTGYEQEVYIDFLENLQKFVEK